MRRDVNPFGDEGAARATEMTQVPKAVRSEESNYWAAGVVTVVLAVVASIAVLLSYWWDFGSLARSTQPSDWGPFGDYVGGLLNPIVGFFALILLTLSMRLQAKEMTRALREFRQGSFEANLWQLIRLYQEFSDDIAVSTETNTRIVGRACFRVFHRRLLDLYEGSPADRYIPGAREIDSRAQQIYELFLLDYEPHVSHYFRLIERILVFIRDSGQGESKGDEPAGSVHVETVRASLSRDELVILFFHGACKAPELKDLIERYHLLRNLPVDQFPRKPFGESSGLYDKRAFGPEK